VGSLTKWRQGVVLDPFAGSGTTLAVAQGCGRDAIGIELYPHNADLIADRCGMFLEVDGGDDAAA
jgi:DNA modification methylase